MEWIIILAGIVCVMSALFIGFKVSNMVDGDHLHEPPAMKHVIRAAFVFTISWGIGVVALLVKMMDEFGGLFS